MGLRVSYIGSTSRKLLNDVDFNTLPASTVPFINDGNPDDARPAAVRAVRLLHGHRRQPRRGPLRQHAAGAPAPVEGRLRGQRGLHAGPFRQQRARHGQQHDRTGPVRSVRHREGPRPRSERRETPARGQCHGGHPGGPRAQARRRHGGLVERPLRRLDRLDDRAGPQRTEPHAVLQQLLHDHAVEHRQAARRPRATSSAARGGRIRSRIRTPADRATRSSTRRRTRFRPTASWGMRRRAA